MTQPSPPMISVLHDNGHRVGFLRSAGPRGFQAYDAAGLSECTAASPVRENALRFRPPEGQARTGQRGADVQSKASQKIPDHAALCARG